MGRAERRRAQKLERKNNVATYNLTKAQLDAAIERGVRDKLNVIKDNMTEDAINTACMLTFTLPMKVLMEHYWQSNYTKKLPEFADLLIEEYTKWQDGETDIYKLKDDLWEYAGVKIVREEDEE